MDGGVGTHGEGGAESVGGFGGAYCDGFDRFNGILVSFSYPNGFFYGCRNTWSVLGLCDDIGVRTNFVKGILQTQAEDPTQIRECDVDVPWNA